VTGDLIQHFLAFDLQHNVAENRFPAEMVGALLIHYFPEALAMHWQAFVLQHSQEKKLAFLLRSDWIEAVGVLCVHVAQLPCAVADSIPRHSLQSNGLVQGMENTHVHS
jgi:hypothetical protein